MNQSDLVLFRDLLIKADCATLSFMRHSILGEERKRYEVRMAQEFGSYGNEDFGYRLANGKKARRIE